MDVDNFDHTEKLFEKLLDSRLKHVIESLRKQEIKNDDLTKRLCLLENQFLESKNSSFSNRKSNVRHFKAEINMGCNVTVYDDDLDDADCTIKMEKQNVIQLKRVSRIKKEDQEICDAENPSVHKCSKEKNDCDKMESKISDERLSYAEGLTIHGVNRIATGGPLNKIIWSILVVSSLVVAVFISKEHWDAYLSKGSKTNLKFLPEESILFPAITMCSYQGINRERRHFSGGQPVYNRPTLVDIPHMKACGQNLTKCGYNGSAFIKVQNYSADYSHSAKQNHLVEFDNTTNCFTISGYTQIVPSDILSIQSVGDRTHADLWSELYINPGQESFPEASPSVYWASEGFYYVNIVKKIITRLGTPYTDCVKGKGTYAQNKFNGNYTVTKCKKGCFWEAVFEKCGAIPQMYKKHMRRSHLFDNKTFVDDAKGKVCLRSVEDDHRVKAECNVQCLLQPCYEEHITMSLEYHFGRYINTLELVFTFQSFLLEVVEEVPAYTWQDLFANFGGCVGLMTGASILSLFELCIFLGLLVFEYFDVYTKVTKKLRKKKK